jgi:hypothetical protein
MTSVAQTSTPKVDEPDSCASLIELEVMITVYSIGEQVSQVVVDGWG